MLHAEPSRFETPTADLVKEAIQEAKELMKVEVTLAKDEVRHEIFAAKVSAIALGAALGLALMGVVLVFVAIALAISRGPIPALIFGIAFVVLGAIAALIGYSALPKRPLDVTRRRLGTDVRTLKERVA